MRNCIKKESPQYCGFSHICELILHQRAAALEEDDVVALGGIAFGEHAGLADDLAAGLLGELHERLHRATRADDIVEQQDVLALDALDVRAVEAELLRAFVVIETSSTQSAFSMYALTDLRATM